MNARILICTLPLLMAALPAGCDVDIEGHHGFVVAETPAPAYVEEGSIVDGRVVAVPQDEDDWVFTGGGWFCWDPDLHVWVHAHHDADWRPPRRARVYHHWQDHPMYHRR